MVVVFRPHVSRWRRAWAVLKKKPQYWITYYPEHFYGACLAITTGIISFGTKFYFLGLPDYQGMGWKTKPYYRAFYEVRRPDDPEVLKWRLPEEYPPHYVPNRQGSRYASEASKYYAWDVK